MGVAHCDQAQENEVKINPPVIKTNLKKCITRISSRRLKTSRQKYDNQAKNKNTG